VFAVLAFIVQINKYSVQIHLKQLESLAVLMKSLDRRSQCVCPQIYFFFQNHQKGPNEHHAYAIYIRDEET